MARPEVTRKFTVGLFCGGAFHDAAFTRVGGCDVVRLYDWELSMTKVACSFFPEEGVVRDKNIRAGNVGVLEADIGAAVPADGWLHLNAGLPCQDSEGVLRLSAIPPRRTVRFECDGCDGAFLERFFLHHANCIIQVV